MKSLTCDLCDHEVQAETFPNWMEAMKPHYAEAHADFMQKKGELPPKEQKAAMEEWMQENKARFEAQSDDN